MNTPSDSPPKEYSTQAIHSLEKISRSQNIFRPFRIQRYEPGKELTYTIKGIAPPCEGKVTLRIEKFAGGGFAGQVYRAKVLALETESGSIKGIKAGHDYAIKIFIPPSRWKRFFRNLMYAVCFQGAFSLQVNPSAARASALWQKLIRRGARLGLHSERAIVDILATFIDPFLGSCGEIMEWVDGRMWRFEVDDNLDARKKWRPGAPDKGLGSPEYRAKKFFMAQLVRLMHEMGAHELARQYEWWTCKGQPNVLTRCDQDSVVSEGNVAVDFKPGLALFPFLPMSPVDFKLIYQGIKRGSFVQFDRGNLKRLQQFIQQNAKTFHNLEKTVQELREEEKKYRTSLPDLFHNHIKLLYSRPLWASIIDSSITSWKIRNIIGEETAKKLRHRKLSALFYYLLGLIPILGNLFRRILGNPLYRRHYRRVLTSLDYFRRSIRARVVEILISWHRSGRISDTRALKLTENHFCFFAQTPLSFLPPKIHRFLTDGPFARQVLHNIFVKPLRLYFKADVREQWLKGMISQGEKRGMLSAEEASHIYSQIKEPFIQKYLKSLAVHLCTIPVTQIVSIIVAIVYIALHPELSWQQASIHAGIILGIFQITPISPGSLARGFYVTFLVLRERNLTDYKVALFLSFFKYIGYLAFPIQMAYRYPELARFMAGRWATDAVHLLPVFGEHGALLEHAAFDMFYNYPLNLRRRMLVRRKHRLEKKARYWHIPLCILAGSLLAGATGFALFQVRGNMPSLGNSWWAILWIPLLTAVFVSTRSGGAPFSKRLFSGTASGMLVSVFYPVIGLTLKKFPPLSSKEIQAFLQATAHLNISVLWTAVLFTTFAFLGVLFTELKPVKVKNPNKEATL